MIRKATAADLDRVAEIYRNHLEYEEAHVVYSNWRKDLYPVRATAENALNKGWLYVGEDENGIFGSIILNQVQLDEYKQMSWHVDAPDDKVFVIHTLCIDPSCQRKGKGAEFLDFSEELARSMNLTTIRIDTYEGNLPARNLYEKHGYEYTGKANFFFQKAYWSMLVCLDKKL